MVKAFLLIVVGLAGDPTHAETFQKWGATLAQASERLGIPRERLAYLVETPAEGDKLVTGEATKVEIEKALQAFASQGTADDQLFVMLIGHGDFDGRAAKFNLVRQDMTAADFNTALAKMPMKQIVFVNTTEASGPFVDVLSGPGRTIVAATRNGTEKYTTLFGGPFIEALSSDAADLDKNKRISVLEAFQFARAEVERAYKREGLLQTEHAILDDNGDKAGTQAPSLTEKDGRVASVITLGSVDASGVPSDPKLAALHAERRELERRVENLRLLKDSMDAAKYASELERLGTELARKTREIRDAEQPKP